MPEPLAACSLRPGTGMTPYLCWFSVGEVLILGGCRLHANCSLFAAPGGLVISAAQQQPPSASALGAGLAGWDCLTR